MVSASAEEALYIRMKEHRAKVAGMIETRDGPTLPAPLAGRCSEIDLESMRPGVYLLLRGDVIVYVGSSVCIGSRVGNHVGDPRKEFDRAVFMRCPPEARLDVEGALIRYFLPELNGSPPADNGRDDEVIERLGLPPMDPEFRKLYTLKDDLRKARAARAAAAAALPPRPPRKERQYEPVDVVPMTEFTHRTHGGTRTVTVPIVAPVRRDPPASKPPSGPSWYVAFKNALAEQKKKRSKTP
jgi:hypothetical protein